MACGRPLNSAVDICRDCCGRQSSFLFVRPAGLYEGPLKELILALKFHGKRPAARVIGKIVARNIDSSLFETADIITPVPLAKMALKARGYNQSMEIAETAARIHGKNVVSCLKKIRETEPQSSLDRDARAANIKGVFLSGKEAKGKKILLFDDVYTTGATMNEAASELLRAGAVSVTGIVAARAMT